MLINVLTYSMALSCTCEIQLNVWKTLTVVQFFIIVSLIFKSN